MPTTRCRMGMIGMHGLPPANFAVNHADVLILCGARVADRTIPSPATLSKQKTIIHMDIDPAEIGKNIGVDIPVVGDIRMILGQLAEAACEKEEGPHIDGSGWGEWLEELEAHKKAYHPDYAERKGYVNPKLFMHALYQKRRRTRLSSPTSGRTRCGPPTSIRSNTGGSSPPAGWGRWGTRSPVPSARRPPVPDG